MYAIGGFYLCTHLGLEAKCLHFTERINNSVCVGICFYSGICLFVNEGSRKIIKAANTCILLEGLIILHAFVFVFIPAYIFW